MQGTINEIDDIISKNKKLYKLDIVNCLFNKCIAEQGHWNQITK